MKRIASLALCLALGLCLLSPARAEKANTIGDFAPQNAAADYRWDAQADINGEALRWAVSLADGEALAEAEMTSQGENEAAMTLWLADGEAPRLQYGAYQTAFTPEGVAEAMEPLLPGSEAAGRYLCEAATGDLVRLSALGGDALALLGDALHVEIFSDGWSACVDDDSLRVVSRFLVQALSDQATLNTLCSLEAWTYFAPEVSDRRTTLQGALRSLAAACMRGDLSGLRAELAWANGALRFDMALTRSGRSWALAGQCAPSYAHGALSARLAVSGGPEGPCAYVLQCDWTGDGAGAINTVTAALRTEDGSFLRAEGDLHAAVNGASLELGASLAATQADATLLELGLTLAATLGADGLPAAAQGDMTLRGLYQSTVTGQFALTQEDFSLSVLVGDCAVSASARWSERGYDALMTYFDRDRMYTVEALGRIAHLAHGFEHDATLTVLMGGREVGRALLHQQGTALENGYRHQLTLSTLPEETGSVFTWCSEHRWGHAARALSPAVFADRRVRELPCARFLEQLYSLAPRLAPLAE